MRDLLVEVMGEEVDLSSDEDVEAFYFVIKAAEALSAEHQKELDRSTNVATDH